MWPRGSMDEDLRTLVESDTPVLVLSGEHDPITPPAWGDAILSGLTGARHLVAPGQGHGVIARGCVPRLAADFVESLDADALDASCLESLGEILTEAGCNFGDVVKTMVWLKERADFPGFNRVYAEYFPSEPPTRTALVSDFLIDILVEIEVVAYKPL